MCDLGLRRGALPLLLLARESSLDLSGVELDGEAAALAGAIWRKTACPASSGPAICAGSGSSFRRGASIWWSPIRPTSPQAAAKAAAAPGWSCAVP